MSLPARWSDLNARMISAVVMVVAGALLLWAGGVIFAATLWVIGGALVWELSRMLGGRAWAPGMGVIAGLALAAAWALPVWLALPGLVFVAGFGAWQLPERRVLFGIYAAGILLACYTATLLRVDAGLTWILWVICVVVSVDAAGYFAGRAMGGPKLWPAISPKKTWSGTLAGWLAGAVMGLAFGLYLNVGAQLMVLSVLIAITGQAGDIWESWIKRSVGVKDSSNLIPGHGGVMDRFDAMLGAMLLVGALWLFRMLPGIL
ncbi:phosphatidate cytidylyltransferase [Roseovarius sp. M141]|uniref:phosphatidate cytidylyltransferase n=1 Tax=Roseovarius sp. M141 TaxID=2583806 RepID=UPI0020CEDE17|nr:phosphatidate cytidylyltransferase [Roseovarius sp. M141]MCQ0093066.1 phosphatidate cytidylyltransferase [Roseovarius sp. M141]